MAGLAAVTVILSMALPTRAATGRAAVPSASPPHIDTATNVPQCGAWVVVPSPNPPGVDQSTLAGIAAISDGGAWAVGYTVVGGAPWQTLAEHWDGKAWTIVDTPNPEGARWSTLQAVTAISPTDVWAVGESFNGSIDAALAEHWDGTAWKIVGTPDTGAAQTILQGVTAFSSSDVWAVGWDTDYVPGVVTEHWNGRRWRIVPAPGPPDGGRFYGASATSANDVWAVGAANLPDGATGMLIEHWDGGAWSIVPNPQPNRHFSYLVAVDAPSGDDVWAVGWLVNLRNLYRTRVQHWNGTTWRFVRSVNDPTGTGSTQLGGVSAVSSTEVWAVGASASPGRTFIERWDGTAWTQVASPNPGKSSSYLSAVAASPDGTANAVGGFDGKTLVESYCP
jgi:hypothetical protein